MGKYIIKRLLQLIPVLIGITFLSFAMMRLAGGDAVTYMYENAGSAVSQEVIDNAKAEYGLDKPFLVQYAAWFAGMVTGDMGESYVSHRDVYETFISKLPATMMLTLSSILLTIVLAIPLGILSAVKHNKWVDYLIRFLSFIGNSMPNFFAAMVLMYFLSIRLGVLPVVTNTDLGQSIILPTLTLAISMAAKYTRQVRATVLEELNIGYVAFSPLANGILSDVFAKGEQFDKADYRSAMPQYSDEAFEQNRELLSLIRNLAEEKNATPAQISLSWMLCKKPYIVPIPGSRKAERIRENLGAVEITLTAEEVISIDEKLNHMEMSAVFGGSPVRK